MIDFVQNELYPLSESQRNIYELETALSGIPINNICSTIMVKGRFDVARLSQTLNMLVESDSTLRTRIVLSDGQAMQYTQDYEPEQYMYYDFSVTGSEGVERWVSAAAHVPMKVLNCALYQFEIFKSDEYSGGILIKLHHIIADGWTLVNFANRISNIYLALLSGEEPDITFTPNYGDHVADERKYRGSALYGDDAEYWHKMLSDNLTGDTGLKKRGGTLTSPVGRRSSFAFSETVNHLINRFCRTNNATPFSVFAMALSIYLSRMTGAKRIALGVPVVNRATFKDKQTSGMFVSTLPFFVETDFSKSLEDFNVCLTESWYDLLRHQKYPFSEISREAKRLSPGGHAMFDIVLSFQDSTIFRDREASVLFSGKWVYSGYQVEQLIIHLSNFGDSTHYSVDYDYLTQVYTADDIAVLHSHICKILEETLSYSSTPLKSTQLIATDERDKLLYQFNRTDREQPFDTVPKGFAHAVSANPNKVALIYKGFRLSYFQLNGKVSAYASDILRTAGSKGVIAICLNRGFELITAMLASSVSANAWVIVAPDLPPERKKRIIADSGASAVITSQRYSRFFTDCGAAVLCTEDMSEVTDFTDAPAVMPGDLAYVVYTSGSTGVPKGVEIEHRSLTNFACAMNEFYGHGGVLSLCNIGFDVFVLESIVSLLNSKTVILADNENDPAEIASLMRGFSVGFIALTPSRLQSYVYNRDFAKALAGVESIVCGGEPISGELVQQINRITKARIYNQYGPSETTIGVSIKNIRNSAAITAGKPMENCKLYVLDEYLNPLPVGAFGKLFIGGMCVGRGYRNNGEATERAFIPNPFELTGMIYDSGDMACWSKDGEIILGERIGSQVKLRGLRIELQEIISVLLTYPGITQATVRVIKNSSDFLAAYYTSDGDISQDDCRSFLASQLPSYMIPTCWIHLSSMPLTANGKIDFSALPVPLVSQTDRAPATQTENIVLDIFRNVLGNKDITVNSDFYQSGGDSLNALIALNEIEAKTGKALKISDIFILKSAARLAAKISGTQAEESAPAQVTRVTRALREVYPLTPIQQEMYLASAMAKDSVVYNMPGVFRLSPRADIGRLEKAFVSLIEQEDLLRTKFFTNSAGTVCAPVKSADFELEMISAVTLADAMRIFVRPFDLSEPPLLRGAVWNDGENRYLLLDIHHIINDALGSALLLRKIDRIYSGESVHTPEITYKDYACFAEEANKVNGAKDLEYWTRKLEGAAEIAVIPSDMPRVDEADCAGADFETLLSCEDTEKISAFCSANGVTPFVLFSAAYGILVSSLTGREDFVIGTPVSCRDGAGLGDMLGTFLSTLPLRINADMSLTVAQYLKEVSDSVNGMLEHKNTPLGDIISATGSKRVAGAGTLYGTLITMRPIANDFTLGGEPLEMIPLPSETAKLDLTLEVFRRGERYAMRLEYKKNLFRDATVRLWASCLTHFVTSLTQVAEMKYFASHRLDAGEAYRLFEKPARLRAPYTDLCVHELTDSFALITPDAPAVIFGDRVLTFALLKRRSDSVAAFLSTLVLAENSTIAVACERSDAMICAVIGILKSGHAYTMLSDTLPVGRINAMADAAGISAVLCDRRNADRFASQSGEGAKLNAAIALIPDTQGSYAPERAYSTSDKAQVIFTSGSTGQPKGVVIPHRAIANLVSRLEEMYERAGVRSVIFSSSVMFDSFTVEVITPLASGRTVIVADEEQSAHPWKLAELISGADAPLIFSTPSRMQVFLADEAYNKALSDVRMIMSGGESVSPTLASELLKACNGDIYNMYGPAEATAFVSAKLITGKGKPTIGKCIANTRIYILDRNLDRVMPTAIGEIYIAGISLADGYAGRSDLTENAFVPDPFVPGERMYRTGDLARLLPDGEVEFAGRADSQVKLNGQRIETDEISGQAIKSTLASDAAAVLCQSPTGGTLTLFYVPSDENSTADKLKEALRKTLPPYMVPSRITAVSEIPYTNTGKADLKRLAEENEREKTESARALSDNEEKIASLWREVLPSKEATDPDAQFFDLGGTSLAAMELVIKYYANGWNISLSDFYSHPTVAQQALMLGSAPESESECAVESVFLTGATGFLGAHILKELLESPGRSVICLVRGDAERLYGVLRAYFGDEWLESAKPGITTVRGDVTVTFPEVNAHIDRVIHAAADVRHYMSEKDAFTVNVNGTANALEFAKRVNAAFAYISTASVSGDRLTDPTSQGAVFDESCRDIGQNKDENIYVRSKFIAEGLVDAASGGLKDAKIFRVGRLVGRSTDGMFQLNTATNSFYKMVHGFVSLGCMPDALAEMPIELTAVDLCARAIVALSDVKTDADGKAAAFHVFNPNTIPASEVMDALDEGLKTVPRPTFNAMLLNRLSKSPSPDLAILMDSWGRLDRKSGTIELKCDKTVAELEKRGFRWEKPDPSVLLRGFTDAKEPREAVTTGM